MFLSCLAGTFSSSVGSERADAAGEAEDARPAFALDLLGAEPKRRDAAIHRQAIARRRAIERRGDPKDFPPPFAQRNSKAALPAQFDIRQRPLLHIVELIRTFCLHAL